MRGVALWSPKGGPPGLVGDDGTGAPRWCALCGGCRPHQFRIERTLGNVGSAATLAALQQDTPLDDLVARWADDGAAFMRRRAAALLY